MSGQESRGRAGEYQADERAGVARLRWRVSYLGMPVTTVALLLPTLMGVDKLAGLPTGKIAPAALVLFAALFLTPVHVKKPARVGKLIMLLLGCAALVIVILAGTEL